MREGSPNGTSSPEPALGRRKELLERLKAALATSSHRASLEAEERVGREAGSALERLDSEGPTAALSPSQASAFEAVVIADGSRPLLFVTDDDVDLGRATLSPIWREALTLNRETIRTVIRSVGRIAVHPEAPVHTGTGWVIGDGLIVTNRHVVEAMGRRYGTGWEIGEDCCIDFVREAGREMRKAFRIRGVRCINTEVAAVNGEASLLDMALLEVETRAGGLRLPAPLVAPGQSPPPPCGRSIYMVGYPGKPLLVEPGRPPTPGSEHAEVLYALTGGVHNVKKLSVGLVTGPLPLETDRTSLHHDATTLGGCSGAPIVDLEGGCEVVGLHVSGVARDRNRAHPASAFADVLRRAMGHSC